MLSYYLCSSNQDVLSFIDILDCPLGRFQVKTKESRQGNEQTRTFEPTNESADCWSAAHSCNFIIRVK